MSFKILEGIGIALGNKKVNNEYFLKQVDENQRGRLEHYYKEIIGKETRYLVDETQTSATLACDAAKQALEKNHLTGKEIDMVICVTYTAERVVPPMSRYVVSAIGGTEDIKYFDMNQNCTGILVAMDIADQYFKANEEMQYILIVQGECHSSWHIKQESPFFGIFSDLGCCIILERSSVSGIKNRSFKMIEDGLTSIVYPEEGYSKPNPNFYTVPGLDPHVEVGIDEMLKKINQEELREVSAFCISQFALKSYNDFLEKTGINKEKVPYIGDQYGYTGPSSPIFALKDCIENNRIERGDIIVLWTYGAGIQHAMLELIY